MNTSKKQEIDGVLGLTISDVHLGGRRTTTSEIVYGLKHVFFPEIVPELDIIFIAGDFFDWVMTMPSDDSDLVVTFITELLMRCEVNDVILRVLEGTPSHDWGQPKLFVRLNEVMGNRVDVKYIPTITYEKIVRLGIDVIYIPDKMGTAGEVKTAVEKLMRLEGVEKVDMICMHGAFTHQMPAGPAIHDPHYYSSLVNGFAFAGHVHQHSVVGNLIVPSSFDRDRHGDEGPKGFIRWEYSSPGDKSMTYIENVLAKTFITLEVRGLNVLEIVQLIGSRHFIDGSHIRLVASKTDDAITNIAELRDKFGAYRLTVASDDDMKHETEMRDDSSPCISTVSIGKDNISGLVSDWLSARQIEPGPAIDLLKEFL